MLTAKKGLVPIALVAMLMTSVATTDASAAIGFDPSLTTVPNVDAAVEKVWWHRHWYRHYSYHYRWHWHRHWR